jgi:hypothetical protein
MRRLWPLGVWPLLVPSVLIILVVLSGTSTMWAWPYQDWLATSSAFMSQLAVPGPVAAAAAAYYASRITGPGRIFALRPGGRPPAQVMRRHLTQLLATFLGSYLLGLAPVLFLSVVEADSGHLSIGVAATGLAALAAFTLLGYAAGTSIRSFVAVPVAFVLSLAIVVIGTTGSNFLSPVPSFPFAIGDVPASALIVVRFVVLILVAIACLALGSARLLNSRRPPAVTSVAAVVIVAFVVLVNQRPPDVSTLETHPPRVCERSDGVEFCVHQGHRQQLNAVAAAARPVLQAYGREADKDWHVYDAAMSGQSQEVSDILWVGVAPAYNESDVVTSDLVGQLVPTDACTKRYGFQLPTEVEALYTYLQTWLREGGDIQGGYDYTYFQKLDRQGMQAWFAVHERELATCNVALQDLPQ